LFFPSALYRAPFTCTFGKLIYIKKFKILKTINKTFLGTLPSLLPECLTYFWLQGIINMQREHGSIVS